MGWAGLDVNLEIDRRQDGHRDAVVRAVLCRSTFADRVRP